MVNANKMQSLVTKFCESIQCFADVKKNRRNVIASIIKTTNDDLCSARVIVMASGTKGIFGENIQSEGTVHDSHAEIVARRSLMVYFYNQVKMLCDENNTQENASQSIFTRQSNDPNSKYRLKDGINFHLYTSRGPCGDATANYSKNNSRIGKLRVKVAKKRGYLLVDQIRGDVQWTGTFHKGAELYTASCSDKIARWNVVGIQGALLSCIIEPIYLNSIIMSQHSPYKESDFTRAFYGRINGSMPQLPPSFRHNKPHIAFASDAYKRNTHSTKTSKHSINWIVSDPTCEKILSKTGLVSEDSMEHASRISKMELMKRFVDVMKRLPDLAANISFDPKESYRRMKTKAIDYNCAKEACIKAFQVKNLGNWNKMQKPSEIEKFTL